MLIACNGGQVTDTPGVDHQVKMFTSAVHGNIAIFPTYKHLGTKKNTEGRGIRTYNVWENERENKYILIIQIVPKEGPFPEDLNWTPTGGRLYKKGLKAAYNSIGSRPYSIMMNLGAEFPPCFILAQEIHHNNTEAIFRILIVPDSFCSERYEPVMEELVSLSSGSSTSQFESVD